MLRPRRSSLVTTTTSPACSEAISFGSCGRAECMLVLIGATPEGKKELVGFPDRGARERAELA